MTRYAVSFSTKQSNMFTMLSTLLNLASLSASSIKLCRPLMNCVSVASPGKTLTFTVPGSLVASSPGRNSFIATRFSSSASKPA